MKIWVTKHCFTAGITEHDAEELESGMVVVRRDAPNCLDQYYHGEGRDWHKTRESAVNRAREMKIKKLQSLDKQIKKISAIEF
jgi:hypothetical protein